jgi:hypothetical protein
MPHFFGALLTASPEPELIEGNLLQGIENKIVRRKEISIYLRMFSSQQYTSYKGKR